MDQINCYSLLLFLVYTVINNNIVLLVLDIWSKKLILGLLLAHILFKIVILINVGAVTENNLPLNLNLLCFLIQIQRYLQYVE